MAEQALIKEYLDKTNKPLFLTGKAGTGKTTFLRTLKAETKKNFAIVAPTAVAAINAGGVTIHSFFQVPFGPISPDNQELKSLGTEKSKLLKCLELLIIDEISMVRADTLDYIDAILQQVKGSVRPFGGVQVLMIGDLFQLPPVYEKEWPVLRRFYDGPYFFNSQVLIKACLLTFELKTVYRQTDPVFIEILNSIRIGEPVLQELNKRYDPALHTHWRQDYVTLSTHNQLVNDINQTQLKELEGDAFTFKATIQGDFPKEGFPAEDKLILKNGAQVMFIRNDSSGKKQYYNGRTAKITKITTGSISLNFLDDGSEFEVVQETWNNVKYTLSEKEQKVSESNNGSFSQYPLKLAWAITIHKSQGLTFDKAIIDVNAAFAFGQAYVALSRCKSLEGMILKEPVRPENVRTDPKIIQFMSAINTPDVAQLQEAIDDYDRDVLADMLDFSVMADTWAQLDKDQSLNALKTIGDRFIRKELPETGPIWSNTAFVVRLKQASLYFLPKLNLFATQLNNFYVAKSHADAADGFYEYLNHLLVTMKSKQAAFMRIAVATSSKEILSSAQEAALNFQPIFKNWNLKNLPKEKEIVNPELYRHLLLLRKDLSEQRHMAEYLLLSENALKEVAAKCPRSLDQLALLKTFGEVKANDFGVQVLKVIRNYLGENELF